MTAQPFFVFAHDLGQTPLQWEDLIASLPPGVGAACPWLRGTRPGGSPVPFSVADAAAALITTLDENGARTGTLVGVGLGGTIALQAALAAPERVDRVVAVSAPAQPSKAQLRAQRMALRVVPASRLAAQNIDKARLLAALKGAAEQDTSDALAALAVPVTLVVGGRDSAALSAARTLGDLLPEVTLQVLPDAAADLPRSQAAALAALLFGAGEGS